MAFQILMHSYRMLINNIPTVLRIALIPWLIMTFMNSAFSLAYYGRLVPSPEQVNNSGLMSGNYLLWSFAMLIIVIILYLWLIVGWHRFILLEEEPNRYLPKWHGSESLSYFGKGFLILLVLIVPIIVYTTVAVLAFGMETFVLDINAPKPIQSGIMVIIFGSFFTFLSLRLSLALPAAAIGNSVTLSESWKATKSENISMVIIGIMITIMSEIPVIIQQFFPTNAVIVVITLAMVSLIALLSVSVVTTYYGLLIEGRKLSD